ncbi:galactosylceramide sulfotransferase-like [Planococcus citri]|uniref:galactosylceramide sulfotransferase-like n=1 Tax=Planococcus citri TaxID=170843 RepID=UPI0031F77E54
MYDWNGKTLQQLLEMPVKPSVLITRDGMLEYRGYNQMSVDLGFHTTLSKNDTAIAEFIEKIDREFDFVMITEYMEESLVLLANLMGWPLEYVAHLDLNVRPPESDSYTLTERDKNIIMDLNHVDTLLYFHFLNKFQKCLRQYDEDKMKHQIRQLRALNEELKERCVNETFIGDLNTYNPKKIIKYIPKSQSDRECVYSMTVDLGLNTSPGV